VKEATQRIRISLLGRYPPKIDRASHSHDTHCHHFLLEKVEVYMPLETYAWFKRELLSIGKGEKCMLFRVVVSREVKLFKGERSKINHE
jgi:hypothetical protein